MIDADLRVSVFNCQIHTTVLNYTVPEGQDEDVELCIKRNVFPKNANFKCLANHRPDKYNITIMSILCNGQSECKGNLDEIGCNMSLR